MDDWKSAAEQIAVSQTIQGTRLLGVIAPTGGSNSSLLARMVSEAMGRSGLKVLLADLNVPEADESPSVSGSEPWRALQSIPSRSIDVVMPNVTPETRDIFNNSGWLMKYFAEQLRKYSNIVLDLPPVIPAREDQLTPLAAASICNAVILMCPTGQLTYREIDKTMQSLKSAKVALIGIVVDEGDGSALPKSSQLAAPFPRLSPIVQARRIESGSLVSDRPRAERHDSTT